MSARLTRYSLSSPERSASFWAPMPNYNAKTALLGNIIDYAGTFAPASLPLPEALKKAATFRSTGVHPWLLAKIALPLSEIKKLTPQWLYDAGADGSSWWFTALASPFQGATREEFSRLVEWDLRELRHCNERGLSGSCRQYLSAYEIRLPFDSVFHDPKALATDLPPFLDRFVALTRGSIELCLEVPAEKESLERVAEVMSAWCDDNSDSGLIPTLKVRTGGASLPSVQNLALVVETCAAHGFKFKATQGLHHAVSHVLKPGQVDFGFVNLFAALAFRTALGSDTFSLSSIEACLMEPKAQGFVFHDSKLEWKGFGIDCDAIEAARRRHGATFGSCSLDEPDESLQEAFGRKGVSQ